MASPSPLGHYAQVQIKYDREFARILERAARDIQRKLEKLALKPGIGSVVRQAQLKLVLNQIAQILQAMWIAGILPTMAKGMKAAAEAAVTAQEDLERVLYASMPEKAADALRDSLRAQAQGGIDTAFSRVPRELSRRVYKDLALSSGQVQDAIGAGIASGLSAKELAADVHDLISPTVPGGVSYAAMRLARTEINNAFHQQQIAGGQRPGVKAIRWNLSGSHKRPDECNEFAAHPGTLGVGLFAPEDVPDKPHPHCLCYMTYEMMAEDDFLDALIRGDFDDQIDARRKRTVKEGLRPVSEPKSKATKASQPPKKAAPGRKKATAPKDESISPPSPGPHVSITGDDARVVQKALDHQHKLAPLCLERLESVGYLTHADLVGLGDPSTMGEYLPDKQRIVLNRDIFHPFFVDKWRRMNSSGWFSRCGHDHEGPESTIHHEFGHHVDHWLQKAPKRVRKRFWDLVAKELGVEPPDEPDDPGIEFWCETNEDVIKDKISEYASTSGLEVLAEVWQEYSTMGDQARPWIKAIGQAMADIAEVEAL